MTTVLNFRSSFVAQLTVPFPGDGTVRPAFAKVSGVFCQPSPVSWTWLVAVRYTAWGVLSFYQLSTQRLADLNNVRRKGSRPRAVLAARIQDNYWKLRAVKIKFVRSVERKHLFCVLCGAYTSTFNELKTLLQRSLKTVSATRCSMKANTQTSAQPTRKQAAVTTNNWHASQRTVATDAKKEVEATHQPTFIGGAGQNT
jgi:hypothetical protein